MQNVKKKNDFYGVGVHAARVLCSPISRFTVFAPPKIKKKENRARCCINVIHVEKTKEVQLRSTKQNRQLRRRKKKPKNLWSYDGRDWRLD